MRGDERHTVRDSDSERGTNPLRLDRRQQVEGRADLLGEAALVPMGSSPKVFSHALADCQERVLLVPSTCAPPRLRAMVSTHSRDNDEGSSHFRRRRGGVRRHVGCGEMGVAVTHVTVSWINSKGTTFGLSQKGQTFACAVRVRVNLSSSK